MFYLNVNSIRFSSLFFYLFLSSFLNCVHSDVVVPNSSSSFNQSIEFKNNTINHQFHKSLSSFKNSLIDPKDASIDSIILTSNHLTDTSLAINQPKDLVLHYHHDNFEFLPKPESRVQQSQHTRSRTGSTTVDLASNKYKQQPYPSYLNQTRPIDSYVSPSSVSNSAGTDDQTSNNKALNKVINLHIGALFPMTSSHSSGWLGGQGIEFFFLIVIIILFYLFILN